MNAKKKKENCFNLFFPSLTILVPLFSKSWGVGIEIAASQHAEIPYPIFTLDRIFSCLLGKKLSP